MNVQGLVKQANQLACKTCDEGFMSLLKEYIDDKNREALELESGQVATSNLDSLENDQENIDQIGNPIVRHSKGRPPGTTKFKGPLEDSSHPNQGVGRQNHQNKCGLYNNVGHNHATCPSNPDKKKRKVN
jgi:hypothetical protein